MDSHKEAFGVALFFGALGIVLAVLMYVMITELDESNEIEKQEEIDMLRVEYERILLGCNTAGAIESEDGWLRELCDVYLPTLRDEILAVQ